MQTETSSSREDAIAGSLLGLAVGDALGLPLERLTPQRARKVFGEIENDFGLHLFFGRGLVSDDTEHAVLTLESFVAAQGDDSRFEVELSQRLKRWFLLLPPGTGMATAKACLKLLTGVPPSRAGVFSAGNGPAMRAPILGVLATDDTQLRALVRTSSRLTHTDSKAEIGALAIALAARDASTRETISPQDFIQRVAAFLENECHRESKDEFLLLLEKVVESLGRNESTPSFAASLGLNYGVSGYIYHTVPVCLHAWLGHQHDFREAILKVLRCGGDADSTAAIVGGIVGAQAGKDGIPSDWLDKIIEWPRSVSWMKQAAQTASSGRLIKTPLWFYPVTFVRNLLLLVIVLSHGFRRLLPPY